jgi:hypothetical protein
MVTTGATARKGEESGAKSQHMSGRKHFCQDSWKFMKLSRTVFRQTPEVVPLKASGKYPQAVAVFPLDCSGVELDAASGSIFDVCPLSVFYLDSFLFFLLCAVWWPSDVCPSAGLLNLSRNCWTQRAQILLEFMKCSLLDPLGFGHVSGISFACLPCVYLF